MKRIIALFLIIILCLSLTTGCVMKSQQSTDPVEPTPEPQQDLSTPEKKIEQSVLLYPAKNATFRYNVYTHYIEIVQCLSADNVITIPETIEGKPVYVIANGAFKQNTNIVTCVLNDILTTIGDNAFDECTSLETINLPKSLRTIGSGAFFKCTSLLSLSIPSTVAIIPSNLCSGCSNLRTVSIAPGGIWRKIQSAAFASCGSLTNIWIPSAFSDIDSSVLRDSTEFLTIYGEPSSAAAKYAADNKLDYVVLTPREFAKIARATLDDVPVINTSIKGDSTEITLISAQRLTALPNYTIPANHKLLQLKFKVRCTLRTDAEFFLNPLYISATVNGAHFPISFLTDQIDDTAMLGGLLYGGEDFIGYILIEVPENWTILKIDFKDCDTFAGQTMFRLSPQHITGTTPTMED